MGVKSYDFTVSSVSANLETYDNPTLNTEDKRIAETGIDGSTHPEEIVVCEPIPQEVQWRTEMSKFKEMPRKKGDNIKLAFLIGFPLVFFIVATVVTGISV